MDEWKTRQATKKLRCFLHNKSSDAEKLGLRPHRTRQGRAGGGGMGRLQFNENYSAGFFSIGCIVIKSKTNLLNGHKYTYSAYWRSLVPGGIYGSAAACVLVILRKGQAADAFAIGHIGCCEVIAYVCIIYLKWMPLIWNYRHAPSIILIIILSHTHTHTHSYWLLFHLQSASRVQATYPYNDGASISDSCTRMFI